MKPLFRLEHIGLAARDARRLKDWYESVLEARLVSVLSETPPAFLLSIGGVMLEIYTADSATELTGNNKLAGWRHLALRVDSILAARAELLNRGVSFLEEIKPAGGGGKVQFFADAEGNLLHLVERPVDWRD